MNQPQLPFEPGPISWAEGVECGAGQLADVLIAARKAGWDAVRMHATLGGYQLEFQRIQPQPVTQEKSKDSFKILNASKELVHCRQSL